MAGSKTRSMDPSPAVDRREVARDSKAPAQRRPHEPRISAEPARHQIDDEQEADDDAVPHQVDEESGFSLGAFARALVDLALGVVLELRRRRQIKRRIDADAAVFLRLLVEAPLQLALEALGLGLELARHLGIEFALDLGVKIVGEPLGRRRRGRLRVRLPLRPVARPLRGIAVLRPVMLRPIVFRPVAAAVFQPADAFAFPMLHDRVND